MVSNKPKVSYITVEDQFSGQRLDNFLLRELKGVPRSLIYRIVRRGEVRVNEGRTRVHKRLQAGDRVRIPPLRVSAAKPTPDAGIAIVCPTLFEDEHIMVIDKPAGIAVHAGSGIPWGLIENLRQSRPEQRFLELVHRLDRDTSGCLIVAKRRSALHCLHADLRQETDRKNRVRKKYQALVAGDWAASSRVVAIPLRKNAERAGERLVIVAADGKYAKSKFTTLRRFGHCTLMEITLITGRTHQARVHAAASGHPILGDVKYGDARANSCFRSIELGRLFLHASYLSFVHPVSTERIEIASPLPGDLEHVIDRLDSFVPDMQVAEQ